MPVYFPKPPSIAASNVTYDTGTVQFSGAGGITVGSDTGQKVTISGPNVPTLSAFRAVPWDTAGFGTTHQSVKFFPLATNFGPFPGNMTVSTMGLGMSWATAATSVSQQLSSTLALGLYTLNAGTLSLISSGTVTFGNTNASTKNGSDRWHGARLLTFAPPAGLSTYSNTPYWMGLMFSSHVTTISGSVAAQFPDVIPGVLGPWSGVQGNSATASSNQPIGPFMGMYSAASAVLPASVARADIKQDSAVAANRAFPYFAFNDLFLP